MPNMKNRAIVIIVILLIVSIGNYFRIASNGSIRTVEFLAIFAIGVFAGVLGVLLIQRRNSPKAKK